MSISYHKLQHFHPWVPGRSLSFIILALHTLLGWGGDRVLVCLAPTWGAHWWVCPLSFDQSLEFGPWAFWPEPFRRTGMFLAGQGSSLSVCLELSKLLSLAHVKTVNLLWIKQFINVNTFLFINSPTFHQFPKMYWRLTCLLGIRETHICHQSTVRILKEPSRRGGGGLVVKSCLTLVDPMDCNPPASSVRGISQSRILEWVDNFLLQQIFLTQGSNPGPLHRQVGSIPTEPPENLKVSWGTNVKPRNFVQPDDGTAWTAQRRGLQSRRSGSLLGCRVGGGSPGRGHRLCSLAWRWEERA